MPDAWHQCSRNMPSMARSSAGWIRRECATVTEWSGPSSIFSQNSRNPGGARALTLHFAASNHRERVLKATKALLSPAGRGGKCFQTHGPVKQKPETSEQLRRISMKFRPLHDRVVVKRIDADEKSAGG